MGKLLAIPFDSHSPGIEGMTLRFERLAQAVQLALLGRDRRLQHVELSALGHELRRRRIVEGACRSEFGPLLGQAFDVGLMGRSLRVEFAPLGFESRLTDLQISADARVFGVRSLQRRAFVFDAARGLGEFRTRGGGLLLVTTVFGARPLNFSALPFESLAFYDGGSVKLLVRFCKLSAVVVQCDSFGLEEITLRGKRLGLRGKSRLLRSK